MPLFLSFEASCRPDIYTVPGGINREVVRLSPTAVKISPIVVYVVFGVDAGHPAVLSEKKVLRFDAIASIALQA